MTLTDESMDQVKTAYAITGENIGFEKGYRAGYLMAVKHAAELVEDKLREGYTFGIPDIIREMDTPIGSRDE